jgi:osmotically-inducible protein OsmY
VAVLLGASLQGCVGAVIGAGATAGTAAMEERGLSGAADDTALRLRINALLSDKDERLWRKVGMQVYMGRVLLTGTVETEAMRAEAVRLAWAAKGVKEVINELQLAETGGAGGFARDTWISTQLKSALLFDKQVSSINYSIETVRGTVYLIGLAQDRVELDRVMNHARGLSYVKKVVNYVQIKRPPSNP